MRRKDGTDYLFVLNFSKQPQKIALGKAVTDLDSGETAEGEKSLNAYETKVYRI